MTAPKTVPQADIFGLGAPFWRLVIGVLVLLALIGSVRRLAARGPTRMTTGLLVTAGAILALTVVGVFLSGR